MGESAESERRSDDGALARTFASQDAVDRDTLENIWRAVHSRYQSRIDSLLRAWGVVCDHDRQELLQMVFLRAYLKRGAFDPERGSLLAWLRLIAYRELNTWRKKRRDPTWSNDLLDGRTVEHLDPNAALERSEVIVGLLRSLDIRSCTIVEERYLEGLSVKEIGKKHGWSWRAVQGVLYRALRTLRSGAEVAREGELREKKKMSE